MNPGPTSAKIFPCGYCEKPVTWENEAVCCDGDNCNIWHHKSCIEQCSGDENLLHRNNVQWLCAKCDTINVDSFSFHSYYLDITHNFYAPIQDSNVTLESFSSPVTKSDRKQFSPLKSSTPNRMSSRNKSTLSTSKSSVSSSTSSPHYSNGHHSQSSADDSSPPFPVKQDRSNLRILSLNCRGIRGKVSEFTSLVDYTKPDIVCGVESLLHGIKPGTNADLDAIRSSEIFPDHYNVYRNDRKDGGGGVFLLIHKSLTSVESPEFVTNGEMNWAKISLKGHKDLYVGVFYMPHRNMSDLTELEKSLNLLNKKDNRHVILCGDFNCPHINWKTGTVEENHDTCAMAMQDRGIQEKLVDVALNNSLTQLQDGPTRYKNLLDLIFSNNPSLIKSCTAIPGISDHDTIIVDSIIRPSYSIPKKRKVFTYKKAN